jgi:ABC-type multidrug transport system ATPase subunit
MQPAAETRGLSKFFGSRVALDDVTFSLQQGEILALLGPNGSGKSTLLQSLAGILSPSEGSALLFGENPVESEAVRARFGFMGHSSLLYADFSGQENLEFYARLYGLADGPARAARWLEYFHLTNAARVAVRGYSQGMRQRLALVRAMLHEPELLLLDEPFAGLDEASSVLVAKLFKDLREQGRTVIVSTHQTGHLDAIAPKYLRMLQGKIT